MLGGIEETAASFEARFAPRSYPTLPLTENVLREIANGALYGGVQKYTERNESDIVVLDPFTGEVKKKLHKPYPNHSAALTTAGGLLFTGFIDGSFAAA
jgi:hypothetical protein